MVRPQDPDETIILEASGVLIKSQKYNAVLTKKRIIFTGESDKIPRDTPVDEIQRAEPDINEWGTELELVLSVLSKSGEIKKVILHFSKKAFVHAENERNRWLLEINNLIQKRDAGKTRLTERKTVPARQETPQKPFLPAEVPLGFCIKCGTRAVEGAVFCNRCGARIVYPEGPAPATQHTRPVEAEEWPDDETPVVSREKIRVPQKTLSFPDKEKTYDKIPFTSRDSHKDMEIPKRRFSLPDKRKLAGIAILCLGGLLLVLLGLFVVAPTAIPGYNNTSAGRDLAIPGLNMTALGFNPFGNVSTTSGGPSSQDLTVPASDPSPVLDHYAASFKIGDGTSLYNLLSENAKSQSGPDAVNNGLAASLSNGNMIETVQVMQKEINGNRATLVADISWNVLGVPQVSTTTIPFVLENNEWKLDTLILSP
jgi:hypothetical protein